jgi:hypothetical protein
VVGATRISPGSIRAPAGSRITLAGPVTVPGAAAMPVSVPSAATAGGASASTSVPSESRATGTWVRRNSRS